MLTASQPGVVKIELGTGEGDLRLRARPFLQIIHANKIVKQSDLFKYDGEFT